MEEAEIFVSGYGQVATAYSYMEARRLVELANHAAALESGDRGR